ncbi:hypothetical protein M407DRAFT_185850 [Tulasnella calospora MUT 4182]|uniref:Heme haloperoxidase family profile domain-containing protein n=1 Tax=Tulasnella calospora MUT 4182 TaxID=1051891 RepID=A0A0C3MIM4_9AGAM|nr:hypothetical protein M407DRAFT_185850 [Tulasnella calospora MUT 4182]
MTVNFFTTTFGILTRTLKLGFGLVPLLGFVIQLHARDTYYSLLNLALFWRPRRPGMVIAQGKPGFGGMWPEYIAPSASDSRSPCPGLNALANHGILPRDGKKLTYKQMSQAIQHAFNLSPALGDQLTGSAYLLDQGRGWINLHDLNTLNIVQHDASFTRPDIAFCPDQSYPHAELVDRLLKASSNGTELSLEDWAYFSGLRRAECKASNGQYSMTYSFIHKFFGSGNAALLYSLFGGRVNDLEIFLKEERFPDGWEPRNREAFGHTIIQAQKTSLEIEFNINENQELRPGDELLDQRKPNYVAVGKLISV